MILGRGLKLLDFMEKRWGIPIGEYDKRVFLLGLETVEETTSAEE